MIKYFRFWGLKYEDKISDNFHDDNIDSIKIVSDYDVCFYLPAEYKEAAMFRSSINTAYEYIIDLMLKYILTSGSKLEIDDIYFYIKHSGFTETIYVEFLVKGERIYEEIRYASRWGIRSDFEQTDLGKIYRSILTFLDEYKDLIYMFEKMLGRHRVKNNLSFSEEVGITCSDTYYVDQKLM